MEKGLWINKYAADGAVESETFDNAFDAANAAKRGSSRFNLPYVTTIVFETIRENVNKYVREIQY